MSSYDLEIKDTTGKPSQWKRYFKKNGYKSIMKYPKHKLEILGKGHVEVMVWDKYEEMPVQFSTYSGRDEGKRKQVEADHAHAFAEEFKGKVYDPQTNEFLINCGPGNVWVPGFHRYDGTYVNGFCRKK